MITAEFKKGYNTVTVTGLWQWDYGQKLLITGLSLPKLVEVHFSSTDPEGDASRTAGFSSTNGTEVDIPDSLLTGAGNIYAFIYLSDETEGETIKKIIMPVTARPKPEDYTSTESSNPFGAALSEMEEAESNARTYAAEAEGWAHGREDMPERAEDNSRYYCERAEGVSLNPPKIVSGNWYVWNASKRKYEDTGEVAGINFPRFLVDDIGNLYVTNMQGSDVSFVINDAGEMEVWSSE